MRLGPAARRRWSIAVGSVVLAFGAIVLARAHGAALPSFGWHAGPSAVRLPIDTPELDGFIALTQGAVLAGGTREVFAEVRVTAKQVAGDTRREPVALAVALDVSGSMAGEKIDQARRAVHELAARMHPEDRLAIVVYNDSAQLLQPLAPVGAVREELHARIDNIYAGGGTNIPSGLELAGAALRDAPPSMVRRLVLVSDGLDGSGVALTAVQNDVAGRASSGMTTSALGVGVDYDERWLTTVADAGRGNYEFLAGGTTLATFLSRELEQASTTIADRTELPLNIPSGWRLTNVYGAERRDSVIPLGALFAGERRRVTLRFEVDAPSAGNVAEMGVGLRYRARANSTDRNLELGRLSLRVVSDEAQVVASRDVTLHAEAVAQWVDARQAEAVDAWRDGRTAEATALTRDNMRVLNTWQQQAPQAAPALQQRTTALQDDLDNFGRLEAGSDEGRGYGLGANASRRARAAGF
jgi:Ca-activated chloride channel family protein